MKLLSSPPASFLAHQTRLFFFSSNSKKQLRPTSLSTSLFQCRVKRGVWARKIAVKACMTEVEQTNVDVSSESSWGKVSAVLFDMDRVLCNSEEPSSSAAVDVFAEMGVEVTVEDFLPFMGVGEANFLGGVASVKGVKEFDTEAAKKRFFEIYLDKYAKPNSGTGFPGALELINQCKSNGLKVAVASSADRIKVDANLAAAGLPLSLFDAIVSADAFENLKPAPDIFLAASRILNVPTSECIVIEDALAGVQAAKAAEMRCIAVTTTLSEENLKEAGPSLVRKEIGSVSIDDILTDEKIQAPELLHASSQNSSAVRKGKTDNGSILDGAVDDKGSSTWGLQGSRREILKYGSLGVALSCPFFAVSNWKAMQYASPKAIWNLLFGVNRPSFAQIEGGSSRSERIQQLLNYKSDVENRKTTSIVPEFPQKLGWLNTTPLQFRRDLKGKVVVHNSPQLSQKTILELLNTKCSSSWQHLKQAHAVILKSGHFQDHYVSGTLVKCYANARFNNLGFALKVFSSVPKPNVFVWNIVLKGCLEQNEPLKVICLYYKMVAADSRPNKFTYPTVFKACAISEADKEGAQVHSHVVKNGLCGDVHVKSSRIQMYASFGCVSEARQILDDGFESDVICWNAMINGYLKCGNIEAAEKLFKSMDERNVGSFNAMISGFARFGRFEEARKLFDEMGDKDEITWSAIIDGYIKGGYYKEALKVFNEMQRNNIRPRKFVLSSVLSACANLGALDQGRWIHAFVKRNSIFMDAVLGTALIDMYAKCGRLDMAWEVFENMKVKEAFSWNAMIGGLAMHGRAEDAIQLFSKMQKEKIRPDGISFVCILKACVHAGWVDEGLKTLNYMKTICGIEPELEHYGCVVDLLGRAGFLAEAEEVIRTMPMEPNAAVWGALLGACRKHGNVELGEEVGKTLLEMEPENGGRYALLSNIYAKEGRWDDVAEVRKLMKERGVRTNPGTSMIDMNGVVHEFKMGDGSHPQAKDIYSTLEKIIEKLKMEGYSPNSSQVLFDIDEEEKETALKYHSEKLAIAFGFINTEPGTTLRIVKNLRVCEDCHSATKLFSKVYKRNIIVRDRVRYHHFRNGKCSCNDFW